MQHYLEIKQNLGDSVALCVVSKHHTNDAIQAFYAQGERIFAENRAQELVEKASQLPQDIAWHFIGHLQRNKVKTIVPIVSMIQSVDSIALAKEINDACQKIDKHMPILAEVHLATTDTNKTGLSLEELYPFLEECATLPYIDVQGLMVMGPHTDDTKEIHHIFAQAEALFNELKNTYAMHILSMGMSDDYPIALEHGSTMVRIGTYLFEEDSLL